MSTPGPQERSGIVQSHDTSAEGSDEGGSGLGSRTSIMSSSRTPTPSRQQSRGISHIATQTEAQERAPVELRAHFQDFAAQLRLHRHNEHKRRMLEHRRQHLQKAVALSGRLQRLSSWIHDGLVEVSRNDDSTNASSFVRVQQHLQDLSDVCISQWNHEIQALDPVNSTEVLDTRPKSASFLEKLSPESQHDCLDFLHAVRSNPRYLIDRFKAVAPAQLSALSTSPRYQNLPSSILASLSQNSGRSSQKRQRIQSYSKSLEIYATSFERKNAITFLLYNSFGSDQQEDKLRISTWAAICAGLFRESRSAFDAIIHQVLSGFVPLGRWQARERIHLFLMDVLQRGAFLTEPFDANRSTTSVQSTFSDNIETDDTREFFDAAVADLFHILFWEGGFPSKALELAQAIEGKLEDPYLQSDFRNAFFFDWFLSYFLRISLNFPENEKMLLQFHISSKARRRILVQLHQKAEYAARQVFLDPERILNDRLKYCVENMIGLVSGEEVHSPYTILDERLQDPSSAVRSHSLSSLTVCADDIIQVLDALSQQYNDPILSSSLSVFSSQYHTANNGFRRLRNELLMLQEPGSSSTSIHPCQENWLVVPILGDGRPARPESAVLSPKPNVQLLEESVFREVDTAQRAAVRLVFDEPLADGSMLMSLSQRDPERESLIDIFRQKADIAWKSADNINELYWNSAAVELEARYPSAAWSHDDSRVLRPLLQRLDPRDDGSVSRLQAQIAHLEDVYSDSKRALAAASKRLSLLKVRMWYEIGVINSGAYDEAKNIARALNYMALPVEALFGSSHSGSSDVLRPGTSTSTTSSMFEQTRVDTINILKAPREHGGSKKLADQQVEMTKKWLDRSGVENFCKGEERIHRFCMEIKMTTRKLVGETITESPVLWASDLWAKEKVAYEVGTSTAFSMSGSTRPPSVMSETVSSTHFALRPTLGSLGFSTRSLDVDAASSQGRKTSLYSLGSHRLNRDGLGSDFGSSLSPGQSWTTTSGESVSSLWSPLPSQSRSNTSASLPSRAPSISTDFAGHRVGEASIEKAKFLEELQHDLTTLLLSDLGNPVWCQGSETDTWVSSARKNVNVTQRLERQQQISRLLPDLKQHERSKTSKSSKRPSEKRRTWSAEVLHADKSRDPRIQVVPRQVPHRLPDDRMMEELQDVLSRMSHHIDPRLKLDTVHEFKVLAMQAYPKADVLVSNAPEPQPTHSARRRGTSLGPGTAPRQVAKTAEHREPQTQNEITDWLKTLLLALQHKTLFRDLQYIAAFIPADTLNKTEKGRAFLHVGLGALACKDEYCRTMVDLADKIVAKDGIKRRVTDGDEREEGLMKAKEYWILAAREGNRIAQRELAGLYLAHPDIPPIMSLPMSLSSEVFKSDMRWDNGGDRETANPQSLCLALHWMQQAADNGDQVALQKLEERKGSTLLR